MTYYGNHRIYLCAVERIKRKDNEREEQSFFGDNGITSTSANHIANIAKEFVQQLQQENAAISFIDCKVSLMTSHESKPIAYGAKPEILQKIPDNLQKITEANSLIAWLREAIKAKVAEMEDVSSMEFEDFLKAENIESPVYPEKEDYGFVEFDDILATLLLKRGKNIMGWKQNVL